MAEDRVVVTGIGVVTPLGADADEVFDRIVAGEHAAREWPDLVAAGFPIAVANRVADPELDVDCGHRGTALAWRATAAALEDAGLERGSLRDVGVFIGSTMGESAVFESVAERGGDASDRSLLDGASVDTFAAHVADGVGAAGPRRSYGTACAAGNYAVGSAARAIGRGRIDLAVAGGVDPFSRIAMLGFTRSRAMAGERCRPFDRNRRGMQLGEGAAMLVLERASHARRRGATVRAVIGGLGLSGDAHHPTAPRPDGEGIAAALEASLDAGGVAAGEIDWINAHGTGTRASDAAEAAAIAAVFGAGSAAPPVSSLKGAIGHCMGAATAIEAALTIVALERGVIPPTVGLDDLDDSLPIDAVTEPRRAEAIRWALNCGYAFGGLNSALLVGAP